MIIHQPIITHHEGSIRVSARIETEKVTHNLPNILWFKFPESYSEYISERTDGFAACLLLVAMNLGEDLYIRGAISPQLLYGMQEYQRIFNLWLPKLFNLIELHCESLQEIPQKSVQGSVATAFSGGVDSFHTLWSHLPQNQPIPSAQITHGLFIQGVDIPLTQKENYHITKETYSDIFRRLNLELITAQTNARQFSANRVEMRWFQVAPVIGTALVLGHQLKRFYIPAALSFLNLHTSGTTPLIDHLLSTETLDIIHHGAGTTRIEKLSILSDFPETYDTLRVCYNVPHYEGVKNCSRCPKCLRTIAMLELLGKLHMFTTFDSKYPSLLNILRWGRFYNFSMGMATEAIQYIAKKKKHLIPLLWIVIIMGWTRYLLLQILPDWVQNPIKRRVSPPEAEPLFVIDPDESTP
ncbi:MAG: hypothetical protein MUO76_05510 [Anaerolineaceae bacterium]|nr:hypothetical protein [Anaerolineaceae bacterium]